MNQSNIDLIISWPKSMDYPLWRVFITQHREFFKNIIIVFTETHAGVDYSDFVKSSLTGEEFIFIDSPAVQGDEDWRDLAVNLALEKSTAHWVWFTEQDLLVLDPRFWSMIALWMLSYDVIGYKEGQRFHPSNMFVKREFINKTRRYFGIVPDKSDHFASFYFDLRQSGAKIRNIKYYGDQHRDTFYHMTGLSHNLSLIQRGEMPVSKVEEFNEYLSLSIAVDSVDPRYKQMVEDYFRKLHDESSN